jgi:splicing factor U2AF subunit
LDDVKREVQKYGTILEMKIPRPAGARSSPGVGKIFIKFETSEVAKKALTELGGRKFSDRTVVAAYFDEVSSPILDLLDNFR